jgi:WD repeat-containing protein 45
LIRVFAVPSFAKLAELRRGVDPAMIFSLVIAPSSQMLAVTSDKSTLHIFDIPHPSKPGRAETAIGGSRSTQTGGVSPALSDVETSQKWGLLGRIPLMPKFFSDTYSFASAPFEIGDEITSGGYEIQGDESIKLYKGIIGWVSDDCLIIVGAGRDSRWERFVIGENREGKRECERQGWKRYRGAT